MAGMHDRDICLPHGSQKAKRGKCGSQESLQGHCSLSLGPNSQQVSLPKYSTTSQQRHQLVTKSLTYRALEDTNENHRRGEKTHTASSLNSKPTCQQAPSKTFPMFEGSCSQAHEEQRPLSRVMDLVLKQGCDGKANFRVLTRDFSNSQPRLELIHEKCWRGGEVVLGIFVYRFQ